MLEKAFDTLQKDIKENKIDLNTVKKENPAGMSWDKWFFYHPSAFKLAQSGLGVSILTLWAGFLLILWQKWLILGIGSLLFGFIVYKIIESIKQTPKDYTFFQYFADLSVKK